MMSVCFRPIAAAALLAMSILPVSAQDVRYPASYFGRVDMPLPQSLRHLEQLLQETDNFEPIADFSTGNRYRQTAIPVGRLDLEVEHRGDLYVSTCTAWIIDDDKVLTNYHCVPGLEGRVNRGLLRMNYLAEGSADSQTFAIDVTPLEADPDYDFAILRVDGAPGATYGAISLSVRPPVDGEELFIVHHPAGQPLRLTRRNCRAVGRGDAPREFRHQCDTLGGSSGAPIFSDNDLTVVGLHFAGSSDVNFGMRLSDIVDRSRILSELAQSAPSTVPPVATAPTPQPADTGASGTDSTSRRPAAGTTITLD